MRWDKRSQRGAVRLRESHPTQDAQRMKDASRNRRSSRLRPDGQTEPDAITCAQCGAPIENAGTVSECWFCESDNFRGARLSNY